MSSLFDAERAFIVDNSEDDWNVVRHLHDWCQLSGASTSRPGTSRSARCWLSRTNGRKSTASASSWATKCPRRTKDAFQRALGAIESKLDDSIEAEKEKNDFLAGVPAIVDALKNGKIVPRLSQRQIPRQGIHHPRPPRSRRLLRSGRLIQLHAPRPHRKHRT